jgi:CHAD domain-containing protein
VMSSTTKSLAPHGLARDGLVRRAAGYRRRCMGYAKALQNAFRPVTVHKLRTHLRRLQSYAELLEHNKAAKRLGEAVSWFSDLRSLNEFLRYLRRHDAATKDIKRVETVMAKEREDVRKTDRASAVRSLLDQITIESLARPPEFVKKRLKQLQIENRPVLRRAFQELPSKPSRKELHRLRLLIKSLRYQQEIAVEMRWGNPQTVKALKRLQTLLGDYTDRHQFVRLAKESRLRCCSAIKKDRRRAYKRACQALLKLKSDQTRPELPVR